MILSVHLIWCCVVVKHEEHVGKGDYDNQHQEEEHFDVSNCLNDQVDVVSSIFEQSHPVEDLDPKEENS